ncbi:MAG: recombination-associated protein RdgC [Xanthomonadales bacterium]|nr:recombination-associated protein RdgC [Xanthomonadales bacterium]
MFRNLRCYLVTTPWPDTEEALCKALEERAFRPCNGFSEKSAGWEAPGQSEGVTLARRLAGADLLELRTQSRVLPAAAIAEALEDRVNEYRERMGQEPPRRELRRLKEETRDELLPKALVKSDRLRGCFIHSESLLIVDAGTVARAEWFVEHLRPCLPGLRCEPLTFKEPPAALIQSMFLGQLPPDFSLGRECRMEDPTDNKSTGTWRNVDLDDETIRRHVREGMRLTQLAFHFDSTLGGVLGEDGVISKLRLVEGDAVDQHDEEEALARQDSDFVLLSGLARRLLARLAELLGGYDTAPGKPAGAPPGASA